MAERKTQALDAPSNLYRNPQAQVAAQIESLGSAYPNLQLYGDNPFLSLNRGGSPSNTMANLGKQFALSLGSAGGQAIPMGFSNLIGLLQNQGQSNPALLNRILAQSSRENQTQQRDFQSRLAQMGLQRSGVGQAIGAAIDTAGTNRAAGIRAQDLALAEQRRREDLQLLTAMLFDPTIALSGAGIQGRLAEAEQKNRDRAAKYSAVGNLVGGVVQGFASGNLGGGK